MTREGGSKKTEKGEPYPRRTAAPNTLPQYNAMKYKTDRALAFARQYRLPMTAGSDAHRREDVALSGGLSDIPIESAEDYVRLLLDGCLSLIAEEGVL